MSASLAQLPQEKRDVVVRTVELFAFGTVGEYERCRQQSGGDDDVVWTLNEAQLEKLRMLSVVTVVRGQIEQASSSRGEGNGGINMLSIPYSRLASELHLPQDDLRQLEDLLIQCIYSNLISAKLDQSSKSLRIEPHVALLSQSGAATSSSTSEGGANKDKNTTTAAEVHGSVFTRDINIKRKQVSQLISTIEQFLHHSTTLLSTLESASTASQIGRKEDEMRWTEVNKVLEESPLKIRGEASGEPGGSGFSDPMDVVSMSGGRGMGGDLMGGGNRRQVKRSKRRF